SSTTSTRGSTKLGPPRPRRPVVRALECDASMSLISTLTLPARLTLRALDDLHVLAETAATLNDVETRMTRHLDALETHAERMVELAERVTSQMDAGVEAAQRLGEQGDWLIAQGGRIVEQG